VGDFVDDAASEGEDADHEDGALDDGDPTVTHWPKPARYCCMAMMTKAPTTGPGG
jgi:hypothetical protein